jgi:hypothetical protein
MKSSTAVNMLWTWFSEHVREFEADPDDQSFLSRLDVLVSTIHPGLSWECGPGSHTPWRFIVSPNLDPAMRSIAAQVVSKAPVLKNWEFLSARPPKLWNYSFVFERENGHTLAINASQWRFVLLRHEDGMHELLLQDTTRALANLDQDERWHIASIVLESTLGEDKLMLLNNEYELLDELEPDLAQQALPISQLWTVFYPAETSAS